MSKILLLMGLPASGKTTFAKNYNNRIRGEKPYIADIDTYMRRKRTFDDDYDMEAALKDALCAISETIILDGLFLLNDDAVRIIKICESVRHMDIYEIHYWTENREKCLRNDKYRRGILNSDVTIKNAAFDKLDLDYIKNETGLDNITAIFHEVADKQPYQMFADKYNISLNNLGNMTSDSSWCLGGTYCNCWGDTRTIDSESQPDSFAELDKLLEEACPTLTYMQYNKIVEECVDIDSHYESDYYGSSAEYGYFTCCMAHLVDMLDEMGLLDIDDI